MRSLNALSLLSRLERKPQEHKGDAGKVLLIGGAPGMAGAILLSAYGSLYSGAGWTIVGMLDPRSAHALTQQPELMIQDISQQVDLKGWIGSIKPDCIAIGPGLGQDEKALELLIAAIEYPVPLVIDADALNILANSSALQDKLRDRQAPFSLTPHPGEAARLLNTSSDWVQANRLIALQSLIKRYPGNVILKGHHTLLGSTCDEFFECQEGNPGMASGGMGDVLTGIIAALTAQGIRLNLDLWEATCLGVQLHAKAADTLVHSGIGPIGLTAIELAKEVRHLLNRHLP